MTNLSTLIDARFPSRRAFIVAFNEAAGGDYLNESRLSHLLAGRETNRWALLAMRLFLETQKQES